MENHMHRALHIMLAVWMLSIFAGFSGSHAGAASGPWQGGNEVQLRLISATAQYDSITQNHTLNAGLEVKLAKGWKIYWRSPGDAGLPPVLDFSDNSAVTSHQMLFPAPARFSLFGLDTFGYGKHVIFPLTLDINPDLSSQRQIVIVAGFSGLVCADICIPVEETLTLAVPVSNISGQASDQARPSDHAFAIAQARSAVPSQATGNGYQVQSAQIIGDQLVVTIHDQAGGVYSMRQGDILIETAAEGYGFAAPVFREAKSHIAITGLTPPPLLAIWRR